MRQVQNNYSSLHPEMYANDIRIQKAKKILSILEDYLTDLSNLELLDIGCAGGFTSFVLSEKFRKVIAIDIDNSAIEFAKNNFSKDNITYQINNSMYLDFKQESFDVIICSQVYEHVPDSRILMDKIYQLLKPGGICYFAAPNRLMLVECHYNLLFLSYLPKWLANYYVRLLNKGTQYYENVLTIWGLKKLVSKFEIIDYTSKIIKNPEKYNASDMLEKGTFKYIISNIIVKYFLFIVPTYVWLLKKPLSKQS
jgi:ubiquinone biosynthesis O-methyltransferase